MALPTTARKPAPVRDRILGAARMLLEEGGFQALSTRGVATSAGCSIGTIYNHFHDFDDVVLHLNAETVEQLRGALSEAAASPAAVRAAALVDAYFDFVEAHQTAWDALFQHYPPPAYELPDWYRAVIGETVRLVIDALQDLAAAMPAPEREGLMIALWSGLHGLASLDRQSKLTTVHKGATARALGHVLVRTALKGAGWNGA